MGIHIIQIDKARFVCGLFWQSLSRPRELQREAVELGRKIGSDLMVVRRDQSTAQAGYAQSSDGAARTLYSLGAAVSKTVAAAQGLKISPDPLPDRNVFTRTDQFSFVKAGIPALAFKFGFFKDTPQFQIEHDWRANRYHAPSDDLQQPGVMKEEAVKLDTYVAGIAAAIGNGPKKPEWLPTSTFKK